MVPNDSGARETSLTANKTQEIGKPVLAAYYLTLAIIFIASFYPDQRLWGISWYGYFPFYARCLSLGIAALVPVLVRFLPIHRVDTADHAKSWLWISLTTISISGLLFYILRARTHFLGDGYQLLQRLVHGGVPIRPWNPGVYFVQDNLYSFLGQSGEAVALLAFECISYVSGVLFLVLCALAANRLFEKTSERVLLLLGLATGGYALLFFGYVENYPMFILWVAGFSFAGLLIATGKLNRWLIVLPLLLAALFHPFAVALIPAAAYLLGRDSGIGRWLSPLSRAVTGAVMAALALATLIALYYLYTHAYFFRFALVPIVHDRFTVEDYTLLSIKHLVDFANLLILLAPGLALTGAIFATTPIKKVFRRCDYQFLMLTTIPCLLICFLIDPKLGMPRDWDVFAFAGVPLTLFSLYIILDSRNNIKSRGVVALLVMSLSAVVLLPRLIVQTSPEKSIALFDNLAALDVRKSRTGRFVLRQYLLNHGRADEAEQRRLRDNELLPQEFWDLQGREMIARGEVDSAISMFGRAIKFDPSFYLPWSNLGVALSKQGKHDSALVYLRIADGMNPYNADTYCNLGGVYHALGDYKRAEALWQKARYLDPDSFIPCDYLLRLYKQLGQHEDYTSLLEQVVFMADVPHKYAVEQAGNFVRQGDWSQASILLKRALARGLDSAYVQDLSKKYPALNVIN